MIVNIASRSTAADIAQIKTAAAKEQGSARVIQKIEALRADKIAVQTYSRSGVDEDT